MNLDQLQKRLNAAKKIAQRVGAQASDFFNNRSQLQVQQKGVQDVVTQVDQAVEQEITQSLLEQFPTDTVFGEESGGTPSAAVWVIDPIDGTSNFVRGISDFCISIAFVLKDEIQIGVIYAPVTDELFTALKGQGAYCNGVPLQASTCQQISEAMIGLGFSRRTTPTDYARMIERLLNANCEYRRTGSAALQLAHTAAGRYDGYFENHLNSWDALAGLILCQEAGAYTAPFLGGKAIIEGNQTLVCSKNLQTVLVDLLVG